GRGGGGDRRRLRDGEPGRDLGSSAGCGDRWLRAVHADVRRHQRVLSRTEAKFATASPPMLKTPASSAFGTARPGASPVSWAAAITCIDTPVAPSGCPLDLSPPDGLTGRSPSIVVSPDSMAWAPWPGSASPKASYSSS